MESREFAMKRRPVEGASTVCKEENEGQKKNIHDPMVENVRWTEKYAETIGKVWNVIPHKLASVIVTFAVFTFGAMLKGEWVIILVTVMRQWSGKFDDNNVTITSVSELFSTGFKMEHFGYFWLAVNVVTFGFYFGIGGFLHEHYYVKRHHLASEWKVQPTKWMSPELELQEIMLGALSLIVAGTLSAATACYIYNGNPSTIYYNFSEYGWRWFFLQFPVIFIYQDYASYLLHRIYHTPFLYKHFHKVHHKFKQPTAFSVTAIHPVETINIQLMLTLPQFTMPVHWLPFYTIVMYTYYHGIISHSGINFKPQWWQPWQPDVDFHDKHHEFTHVNFGFNIKLWDRIHGTAIKQHKVYNESTFHETSY